MPYIRPLALFVLFCSPAVAQENAVAPLTEDAPKVIYRKVTELDIDDAALVDGALNRPSVGFVMEGSRGTFAPMVRLRTHFAVEMRASVDDIE
jgi:hypothetical protein